MSVPVIFNEALNVSRINVIVGVVSVLVVLVVVAPVCSRRVRCCHFRKIFLLPPIGACLSVCLSVCRRGTVGKYANPT